jgi:hypothetical protein
LPFSQQQEMTHLVTRGRNRIGQPQTLALLPS